MKNFIEEELNQFNKIWEQSCEDYTHDRIRHQCDLLKFFLTDSLTRMRKKTLEEMVKMIKSKSIIWIAEYAYRKANPECKMNTPSIVYEQVEKDYTKFLEEELSKKL